MDIEYFENIFKEMENHKIDTWDYQWAYTIMRNNGICINPSRNLIRNIGFGPGGIHTIAPNAFHEKLETYSLSDIIHPQVIKIDDKTMIAINRKAFDRTIYSYLKGKIKYAIFHHA